MRGPMQRMALGGLLLSWLLPWLAGPAAAQNFERYCAMPGFADAQRQTIVVLDEHEVFAEADAPDGRNRPWRQFLGMFLLPSNDSALEQNFAPRERVTLVLARKDGGGLRQIFSGCLPTYSAAERKRIAQSAGLMQGVHEFFGGGPLAEAKHDMDLFRIGLGNAVRGALAAENLSSPNAGRDNGIAGSGLIASLRQSRLFNAYYGLPRVVLYADVTRFFGDLPQASDAARARGLSLGQAADLNLGGAELYLAGAHGGQNGAMHDALESFFLATHAGLAGIVPAGALPAFDAPPRRVMRFQGLIRYPDNSFPIRLRIATDENGSLVNSWLSMQASHEQFVPLHGILNCDGDSCSLAGDQQFAQVWNARRRPGSAPAFDQSLPFAGARMIDLTIQGERLRGSISDPLIRFEGVKSLKLEFSATRQVAAQF